jgi:hypothetical protein
VNNLPQPPLETPAGHQDSGLHDIWFNYFIVNINIIEWLVLRVTMVKLWQSQMDPFYKGVSEWP